MHDRAGLLQPVLDTDELSGFDNTELVPFGTYAFIEPVVTYAFIEPVVNALVESVVNTLIEPLVGAEFPVVQRELHDDCDCRRE